MFKKKYECLWCDREFEIGLVEKILCQHLAHEICKECAEKMRRQTIQLIK